jgi:hypothetical protein
MVEVEQCAEGVFRTFEIMEILHIIPIMIMWPWQRMLPAS